MRQAPYFVTSRTLMPSVLVELGFLTNNAEEDFLHSNDGQTYMASAIYRAIKEYNIQQQQNKVISILDGIDNNKVIKKDEKIQAEIAEDESSVIESAVYKVQIIQQFKNKT